MLHRKLVKLLLVVLVFWIVWILDSGAENRIYWLFLHSTVVTLARTSLFGSVMTIHIVELERCEMELDRWNGTRDRIELEIERGVVCLLRYFNLYK